jgi:hypothetical protein
MAFLLWHIMKCNNSRLHTYSLQRECASNFGRHALYAWVKLSYKIAQILLAVSLKYVLCELVLAHFANIDHEGPSFESPCLL